MHRPNKTVQEVADELLAAKSKRNRNLLLFLLSLNMVLFLLGIIGIHELISYIITTP